MQICTELLSIHISTAYSCNGASHCGALFGAVVGKVKQYRNRLPWLTITNWKMWNVPINISGGDLPIRRPLINWMNLIEFGSASRSTSRTLEIAILINSQVIENKFLHSALEQMHDAVTKLLNWISKLGTSFIDGHVSWPNDTLAHAQQ